MPHDVIYRPKTGFGAPLRYWLGNELQPLMSELVSEESISMRGIFDYAGVKKFIEDNDAGRVDGTYTIFALMCIEMWCRIFIDNSFHSGT